MPDNLTHPDHLDLAISAALATPPRPQIPPDFAARIATDARARFGPISQPQPAARFGTLTARAAIAILLLAMLLLARIVPPASPLSFALEATFAAEFILLALYLARPLHSLP